MNPETIRKLKIIFGVILVIVLASDFLVQRPHIYFIWDRIPGFSAAFGFISAVVIIVIAKIIAPGIGLVKREDDHD